MGFSRLVRRIKEHRTIMWIEIFENLNFGWPNSKNLRIRVETIAHTATAFDVKWARKASIFSSKSRQIGALRHCDIGVRHQTLLIILCWSDSTDQSHAYHSDCHRLLVQAPNGAYTPCAWISWNFHAPWNAPELVACLVLNVRPSERASCRSVAQCA